MRIIAKHEVQKLVEYLQTCKFSILIDESTDISNVKMMCIRSIRITGLQNSNDTIIRFNVYRYQR